jgi:hypothetical protein
LSQYAYDTFLILDGREISLKETLSCFESFYKASGLKMNASKTKQYGWETKNIQILFYVLNQTFINNSTPIINR